ncbi:hypothetical protein INR49_006815 [Caranx melampygus]|nr:hypothetical protein INR49_006815 [Caranx melampygus]
MTIGETDETGTCGRQVKTGRMMGGGGKMKLPLSFTTLSTIAIQAGQSQIVVSVLRSGLLVHLQLVQVHPGLCEIGSNQEENHRLIQEQQQLIEKLKRHESEVLSGVENGQQTEQRRRRDEGMMEQRRKKKKDEAEVYKAMGASLREGWLLLLNLLDKRQEVLMLASDFYHRAQEFAVSIDRVEDLQMEPGDRLTEVQLRYESMRRDLLVKSLQVLTSSNVLAQNLKELQRTEALQRRGGVLQDQEREDGEETSSQCSRGAVIRLEELVEALQDRRRRADQAVRVQLKQAENGIMVHEEEPESRPAGSEDWTLMGDEILTLDLQPDSATNKTSSSSDETTNSGSPSDLDPESKCDLKLGSKLDVKPGSRSKTINSELGSDIEPKSRPDMKPGLIQENNKDLQADSGLDSQTGLQLGFSLEPKPGSTPEVVRNLQSGFRLNLKARSTSGQISDSKSEDNKDLKPGSVCDEKSELRSETRNLLPGLRSDVEHESRSDTQTGSMSDSKPEFRLDSKPGSRLQEIKNQLGFRLNPKTGPTLVLKTDSTSEETRNLQPNTGLQPEHRPEKTVDIHVRSASDIKHDSKSDLKPGSEETTKLQPGSRAHHQSPDSTSEETRNFESGSRSDLKPGSITDVQLGSRSQQTKDVESGFWSEQNRNLEPQSRPEVKQGLIQGRNKDPQSESRSDVQPRSKLDLQPGFKLEPKSESGSEENRDLQSEFRLNPKVESTSDLKSESKSEETRDHQPGSTSDDKSESKSKTKNLQPGSRSDVKPGSRSDLEPGSVTEENKNLQPESTSDAQTGSMSDPKPEFRLKLKPGSRLEEIKNLHPGFRIKLKSESTSSLKSDSRSEETREHQPGSRTDAKPESRSDLKPGSGSEKNKDMQPESRSEKTVEHQLGSVSDIKHEFKLYLKPGSEEPRKLQPGSRSDLKTESKSVETGDIQPRSTLLDRNETTGHLPPGSRSEETRNPESAQTQSTDNHTHQVHLTNQRQELLSSCEHLLDKVWSWVQQGSSVLSNSSEAGRQLHEAEDTLKTHLQLHTQAESAGRDAENLKQILGQIQALHPDRTSRHLSPLRALTEQLKRGDSGRDPTTIGSAPPAAGSLSPELTGQVDLVLKELQSLKRRIESNLQLLKPYVTFLQTAQQVKEKMEELKEICRGRPEEEGEASSSSRSPLKKKEQVQTSWKVTLQRLLSAQELGHNYIRTVTTRSGAGLNLHSVVSVVQQTIDELDRTKEEVNELQRRHQIKEQQQRDDQESCRKFREQLLKTVQDLNSVSELLDSCTLLDLGSDLQTCKLLEHFSQARPHFTKLDAEVEHVMKSWETLRGVQERLEEEVKGGAVKEEDLSDLLNLQRRVKDKIQQSESVLDLTSSFHLTVQQLEALLRSDPSTGSSGSAGSGEAELNRCREDQQKIQSLFKTVSALKTDICTAVTHSAWARFRLQQLDDRLLSLDSLCVSWLKEAARREEKHHRELLTRLLNEDIHLVRPQFRGQRSEV